MSIRNVFEAFSDNPFLFDSAAVLYETTKPHKAGSLLNYLGKNYTLQQSVGARKKVLLIKDGLVAIPEEATSDLVINTRTVLDRRVGDEIVPALNVPSGVWALDGYNSYLPKSAYYYYDQRKAVEFILTNNFNANPFQLSTIYVDPTDTRKRPLILFWSTGNIRVYKENKKIFQDTSRNAPIVDFSSSYCNGWIWSTGARSDVNTDPTPDNGLIFDLRDNSYESALDITLTGDYSSTFFGGDDRLYVTQGTMKHLSGTKDFPVYYKRQSYTFLPGEAPPGALEREIISTYNKPKIADTRRKRSIGYEITDVKYEILLGDSTVNSRGTHSLTNENNHGCYLYDFSLDPQNPTKQDVNFYGPYVLSLFPNKGGNSSDYRHNYSVGETITVTYGDDFVGQGFQGLSGDLMRNEDNTFVYLGTHIQKEEDEYLEASTLPIEDVYGWLPTTDSQFFLGVKGRITSLSRIRSNKALGSGLVSLKFTTVNPYIYRSFVFEITEILVKKTKFNQSNFSVSDPYSKWYNPSTFTERGGWLKFGKAFQNANADPYDHPLNYLINNAVDILDAFTGITVFQDSWANKYWWEGDYLWHLVLSNDGIGTYMYGFINEDKPVGYIPRYQFVWNTLKNRWDLHFDTWEEFKVKSPPKKRSENPSFLLYNDLTIVTPMMEKAAKG